MTLTIAFVGIQVGTAIETLFEASTSLNGTGQLSIYFLQPWEKQGILVTFANPDGEDIVVILKN